MKSVSINLPEGIKPEAIIYVLAAASSNPVAIAALAARFAGRDDRKDITQADCRTAVEFLRLAMANEIARLSGAPASIVASGSSVLIQHGEGL